MNAMKKYLIAAALMVPLAGCTAMGAQTGDGKPGGDYANVGDLTALPDFIPGMGTLYVQPSTLPLGPFLAYDREGRHISTVYMVPLEAMNDREQWTDREATGRTVESVDMTFNPGHPGVEEPHYHITLWHVSKADAALE